MSEYVCIREYDGNHGLNDEMMDTFMSRYCEENGLRYVEWFDVKEPGESGYVRLCVFLSEDRSVFGMGYEYPNEKEAVRAFRSGAQLFFLQVRKELSALCRLSVSGSESISFGEAVKSGHRYSRRLASTFRRKPFRYLLEERSLM